MRIMLGSFVALLGLSALGCSRRPADPCAAPEQEPSASLACRLGDRHAMVLLLHPERWQKDKESLLSWVARATRWSGSEGARIEQVLREAPDAWAALARFLRIAGTELPERLEGLDLTRPLALGLFETDGDDLAAAAELLVAGPGSAAPFWDRHRLLLPATDSKVLLGSLSTLLSARGLSRLDATGEKTDAEAWFAHRMHGDEGAIGLLAEDGRLRVELLYRSGTAPQAADLRKLSAAPALARTLTATPAFQALCRADDLATLYLRPWLFRPLSIQRSLSVVLSVLSEVDPAYRASLLAQGVSEVLSGYLWMSPLGAEMDDSAMGLSLAGGLRLWRVSSLTALGQRIFREGRLREGPAPASDAPLAEARLSFDLAKALGAAEEPAAGRLAKSLDDVLQAPRECGVFCLWYSPFRHLFGMGKMMLRFAEPQASSLVPKGLAVVLQAVGTSPSQLRLAAAADFEKSVDLAPLRELARTIEGNGALRGSEVPLSIESLSDRQFALLGINQDPKKLIARRDAPGDLVAELRVDLAALARALGPPGDVLILAGLSELRLRAGVVGQALVIQGALGLAGGPSARLGDWPAFAEASWESPGLAAEASSGGRCLFDLVVQVGAALRAISSADPAQKGLLLARAIAELEPSLACAEKDAHTRDAAARISAVSSLFAAELYLDDFAFEPALKILAAACQRGDRRACERKEREEKAPRFRLAQVERGCASSGAFNPRKDRARLAADGTTQLPERAREDLLLAVDRDAPFETVTKLLERLPEPVLSLELAVRNGQGDRRALLVARKTDPAEEGADELIVALRPTGDGAELSGPGGTILIERPAACQAREECPELEAAVADTVQKVKLQFPRGRLYLDAPRELPWREAARLLAGAECCQPLDEGPAWIALLGPPPAAASPSSKTPVIGKSSAPVFGKSPVVAGPYDTGDIQRVVRMNLARFRHCYELVLMQDPTATALADVRFTIGPKGTVIDARVSLRKQSNPRLEACLDKTIRGLRFPAPAGGGVVTVNYPFNFQPGD